MAVYLDSSAFDHLYRKVGCIAADIANLRTQVYGRELTILLSIHTLEDFVLDHHGRPEAMTARTKLTLSLSNFRRMVKPCDQLLIDDIRAYVQTGEAGRPSIDANLQNVIGEGIAAMVESDGEDLDEDMIAALEAARGKRSWFSELAELLSDTPRESLSFEAYCERETPRLLEAQAKLAGTLESCRARGFEGLLTIPSVSVATKSILALTYGRTHLGWEDDDRAFRDLCHAPSAAAVADTLVSDHVFLRQVLAQISPEKLTVSDLPSFLQRVG